MAGKSKIGVAGLMLAGVLATAAWAKGAHLAPPDLEGVWTNETLTRFERPPQLQTFTMTPEQVAALEQPGVWRKVMRVDGQARTSLLTTPDGRVPPLKAGAQPDPRAYPLPPGGKVTDNPETQAIDDRCLLPIASNAGPVLLPLPNNSNYQIVQTREVVAITSEMIHDVRLVRLNAPHRTDGLRPWLGDSIGWYEGATLVVETTSFPAAQAFRGSWRELKVTERFTRVAKDRLRYRFLVEDPTKWDRPWGGEYEFQARAEPLEEYACREGEKSVEHMLDAARAEERSGH